MKKIIIGTLLICSSAGAIAQDIAGSWVGLVAAGGQKLHLIFNITKNADQSYIATFDSPDQKVSGIGTSKTYLTKDSLFIEIAAINGGYKGKWDCKDAINGNYSQGTFHTEMNLNRISADEKAALSKDNTPARPQTPKPPFGYFSEEVEYDNAGKSLHYGATFTRPNGSGKYPAVIIITGSGTQDRDGTLFAHKLYWVLADYLTRNGIAVLRVDDRGAGKSTLGNNIKNVTSLDFSYDVEASLNYLETRADVDKKHLGLVGHSEGGIIAPMVAARRKDVSFVVLWAGAVVGGAKINTEQNGYALRKAGIDSSAVNAFIQLHSQVLKLFATSASREILDQQITPVFEAWKKVQTQKTLDALYVHDQSIVGKDISALYNSLYDLPWMRYFITYHPETDLAKVKCPILAVNGDKDTQVNAAENLSAIKAVLSKSGNKDFEVKVLPGLNHLFQTAKTGDLDEYEKIEETMSPVALNIICSWIKIHTQ